MLCRPVSTYATSAGQRRFAVRQTLFRCAVERRINTRRPRGWAHDRSNAASKSVEATAGTVHSGIRRAPVATGWRRIPVPRTAKPARGWRDPRVVRPGSKTQPSRRNRGWAGLPPGLTRRLSPHTRTSEEVSFVVLPNGTRSYCRATRYRSHLPLRRGGRKARSISDCLREVRQPEDEALLRPPVRPLPPRALVPRTAWHRRPTGRSTSTRPPALTRPPNFLNSTALRRSRSRATTA